MKGGQIMTNHCGIINFITYTPKQENRDKFCTFNYFKPFNRGHEIILKNDRLEREKIEYLEDLLQQGLEKEYHR